MPTFAIATEYDDQDAKVFRVLLERLLGTPVDRWQTPMRFNGDKSVRKLAKPYLATAAAAGVQYALFAIDNDGGAKRRPEHSAAHDPAAEASDEKGGCRVCWLAHVLPPPWVKALPGAVHGNTWEIPSFCSRFQREIEHEGEKTGRFSRNFASRLPAFM